MALTALLSPDAFAADGETTGPHGKKPTPAASLMLATQEEQKIQDSKFAAALVWHEMSEYTNAVNRGARDEFKRLRVEVTAEADKTIADALN